MPLGIARLNTLSLETTHPAGPPCPSGSASGADAHLHVSMCLCGEDLCDICSWMIHMIRSRVWQTSRLPSGNVRFILFKAAGGNVMVVDGCGK